MSEEVRARLVLAFIGVAFGAIPLIYACIRKQYVLGGLSLLVCGALSAAGFPYLALPLAGGAFYLIYVTAKRHDEAQQKKNRAAYKKKIQQQMADPELRMSGYIENKNAAGAAWPPVDQYIDEDAAKSYLELAEREEAERIAALQTEQTENPQ